MEKTPLAQLIDKLNKADETNPHLGFNLAARWAKELLPAERKMANDIYSSATKTVLSGNWRGNSFDDYFDQNYEQWQYHLMYYRG